MRRYSDGKWDVKRILTLALAALIITAFAGCAKESTRPAHKKLPPSTGRGGDVMHPATTPPSEESSAPERHASMGLIEKGKGYLDSDNFELALTTFRDAINLDTNNGMAYYYLALTYYYLKQPDQAAGVLDKADQLLGNDEGWKMKIEELRVEIGKPSPPVISTDKLEDDGF